MKSKQDAIYGELLGAKENITGGKIRENTVSLSCAQKRRSASPEGRTPRMTRKQMVDELVSLIKMLDFKELSFVYRFIKKLAE